MVGLKVKSLISHHKPAEVQALLEIALERQLVLTGEHRLGLPVRHAYLVVPGQYTLLSEGTHAHVWTDEYNRVS